MKSLEFQRRCISSLNTKISSLIVWVDVIRIENKKVAHTRLSNGHHHSFFLDIDLVFMT